MVLGMEIEVVLCSYDIFYVWLVVVEKEVVKFKLEVVEKDKEKCIDLCQVFFVIIDGEDVCDFDDVVYVEVKCGGGWCLFVVIVDVLYYVKVGLVLDEEVVRCGNLVYFFEWVILMLLEVLFNGFCLLNLLVDWLVMVCEMILFKVGKLIGYQFYEVVIYFYVCLIYIKVSQLFEYFDSVEVENLCQQLFGVVLYLQQLYVLYKVLLVGCYVCGVIDFEIQEICIVFGVDWKILEICLIQCNDVYCLIEECMFCVNVVIVCFLQKYVILVLYWVYDGLLQEKFNNLCQFFGELGLSFGCGKVVLILGDYQELLEKIYDCVDFCLIQMVMLCLFSQVVYSLDNNGYFGFNYDVYIYFILLIWCYLDLLVYCVICSVICFKVEILYVQWVGVVSMFKVCIYLYDELCLDQLGEQCLMIEWCVDEVICDVINWLKCEYMCEWVGEIFFGVIIVVIGFGLFVELIDIFVEGLVYVIVLFGDYYYFDVVYYCFSGECIGCSFCFGDIMEVVVVWVDLDEWKIDFELVGNVLSVLIGCKKCNGDKLVNVGKVLKGCKGVFVFEVDLELVLVSFDVVVVLWCKVGKVQVLLLVVLELLVQVVEMFGNIDVCKSCEVKQVLFVEVCVGGKDKGGKKGKVVFVGKSVKGKVKDGKFVVVVKLGKLIKYCKGFFKLKVDNVLVVIGVCKCKVKL